MTEHARTLHARLHLLDRQVASTDEDRLICKVDDLEVRTGDGPFPYVTAILSGPLALGPRIGGVAGWLMAEVGRLFRKDRSGEPYRIAMGRVTEIGSAVRVAGQPRDLALERWLARNVVGRIPGAPQPEREEDTSGGPEVAEGRARREDGETLRMSTLLARVVRDDSGNVVGNVVDVRLVQDGPLLDGVQQAFRLAGFVVARRRAGQLFGYERAHRDGHPALVAAVVRRLHGEIRYADWDEVASLGDGEVRLRVPWERLRMLDDL
ncbi:hypothetical protein [Microbispora sp. ATCC PTA-5024]|uniref:hypothetical protein n=1 Tax=Microbispora sp. ATCC PTA-5024 TaxID=316330 RepID=UPI0003DBD5B7|nr:hypothetical protein [Microbispora sp. ATCC PTA-5024]ETK31758.1 hypothetical protein MPTA5024_33255 [Microbispora sp. ATCC PTA-5024]